STTPPREEESKIQNQESREEKNSETNNYRQEKRRDRRVAMALTLQDQMREVKGPHLGMLPTALLMPQLDGRNQSELQSAQEASDGQPDSALPCAGPHDVSPYFFDFSFSSLLSVFLSRITTPIAISLPISFTASSSS